MPFIIRSKDKTLQCENCDQSATLEAMKNDSLRMYQTTEGILCECCYEDYCEHHCENNEDESDGIEG